jgi:hypothetical protein
VGGSDGEGSQPLGGRGCGEESMRRSGAVGDEYYESAGDTVVPRIEDSCEGIGESMCGSCRSIGGRVGRHRRRAVIRCHTDTRPRGRCGRYG